MLFLDLDRFKRVNDQYGHLVGSNVLRRLSEVLFDCVRQVDTLARYGGDEFTILLVDTALRGGVHGRRAHPPDGGRDDLRRRLAARRSGSRSASASRPIPDHGRDREGLLDAADKAMYRAKSKGRNCVCSAAGARTPAARAQPSPRALPPAPAADPQAARRRAREARSRPVGARDLRHVVPRARAPGLRRRPRERVAERDGRGGAVRPRRSLRRRQFRGPPRAVSARPRDARALDPRGRHASGRLDDDARARAEAKRRRPVRERRPARRERRRGRLEEARVLVHPATDDRRDRRSRSSTSRPLRSTTSSGAPRSSI